MRILLIDQFSEIGGAQRGFLEAAAGFAERGWELHAVIPSGPLAELVRPFCRSVSEIPCGPYRSVTKTLGDALRFAHQVREQAAVIGRREADILYVNGPRMLPASAWASRGRPIVFHAHSVVTQAAAVAITRHALQWADAHVLASSNFVARWLRPFVPADRLQVVYNGVGELGGAPVDRERRTRIGVLGRIAPEKGQLTFVRAARIAVGLDARLMFVITGAPVFSSAEYVESVRTEAGPYVRFEDWTEDIAGFFASIDLLVVPSASVDANPRVIPEAYAAGVPVIAFNSGGIGELLEHGETGILVNEHSSHALASAIFDAVRNPSDLNRMARNGYRRWLDRYTLARFQSEVCESLQRVVEARSPLPRARARASA